MESLSATGRSVEVMLQWISKANHNEHCWKFNPDAGGITIDAGKALCSCLKLDAFAEEDGKRLWDSVLKRANLEHEREGWFEGAKAKALCELFHDGWDIFKRGDDDEITNIDWVLEFMCAEMGNWGFAIDESNGEMTIGAARDVHFLDSEVKREAVGEMPILRHC